MKILIAYSTKNGTVRTCVERLLSGLHNLEADAVDLDQTTPDVDQYDIVLVGASVYFGKLRPAARKFLEQNEVLLAKKSLGLFLCCGLAHDYEYYVEKCFPQSLREVAFQTLYFGGLLKVENCSLTDRILLHSMRSRILEEEFDDGEYTLTLPGILPESIDKMATYVRVEYTRLAAQ